MNEIIYRILKKKDLFYIQVISEEFRSNDPTDFSKWKVTRFLTESTIWFTSKPKTFLSEKDAENYIQSLQNNHEGYELVKEIRITPK